MKGVRYSLPLRTGAGRWLGYLAKRVEATRREAIATDRDFQPHNSGVTPCYREVATFMRATQAPIAPKLDIALAGMAAESRARGR